MSDDAPVKRGGFVLSLPGCSGIAKNFTQPIEYRRYLYAVNLFTLIAPALAFGLLVGCAPAASNATLTTPILAQGQEWTMTVPPDADGRITLPLTLLVGTPERLGSSVAFKTSSRNVAASTTGDYFFYDPLDSEPEFVAAIQTKNVLGFSMAYACVVRTPNAQLNVAQVGLYRQGISPDTLFKDKDDAIEKYVTTGDLKDERTCTLARTK